MACNLIPPNYALAAFTGQPIFRLNHDEQDFLTLYNNAIFEPITAPKFNNTNFGNGDSAYDQISKLTELVATVQNRLSAIENSRKSIDLALKCDKLQKDLYMTVLPNLSTLNNHIKGEKLAGKAKVVDAPESLQPGQTKSYADVAAKSATNKKMNVGNDQLFSTKKINKNNGQWSTTPYPQVKTSTKTAKTPVIKNQEINKQYCNKPLTNKTKAANLNLSVSACQPNKFHVLNEEGPSLNSVTPDLNNGFKLSYCTGDLLDQKMDIAINVSEDLFMNKGPRHLLWTNVAKVAGDSVRACSTATPPQMPPCEHKPRPYKGPDYTKVQNIKKQNLVPCILSYYKKPLLIHEGHMQWLFDHTGKRYLDMFGGIVTVSVGHCHPRVTAAAVEQMQSLWHTTNIYMHPKLHEYAEALTAKLPGDLKVVYFVNSGSEANDLAMLMARAHTRNFDVVSLRNGYHGMNPYVMGVTALSTWRFNVPLGHGVHHTMNPDVYQGIWGGSHCRDSPVQTTRKCNCSPNNCEAADKYYQQLEEVFKYSLPRGRVAGFFAESIQGVGGTVQFPKGYLQKAFEIVRANGGVCISDEVQTGFGRTGETYWGFESHGVVPDIVTMAKGIGNGFPLAAVVTTPKIAEALGQALHFNTYGGNPIACAVGLEVLKVIEDEGTQVNSHKVGTHLLKRLAALRDQFPNVVGDVRGKGLMIGVELVAEPENRTPLPAPQFLEIWEECKDQGVLLGRGGLHGNVLRIKPPMIITKTDADFAADVLSIALARHCDTIAKAAKKSNGRT